MHFKDASYITCIVTLEKKKTEFTELHELVTLADLAALDHLSTKDTVPVEKI